MDTLQEPTGAFMSALVTEHSVLQGARSTLTGEIASRAALYLGSLTGSLIALGFVAQDRAVLGPFATAILPALLILGEFTYWRLVQGGIEDIRHSWEIHRIRAYYRQLAPPGMAFFADAEPKAFAGPERRFIGIRARDLNVLLGAASMVAAINSMLAGAGVALALGAAANISASEAVALAALIAVLLYLAHSRLAISRYQAGLADFT